MNMTRPDVDQRLPDTAAMRTSAEELLGDPTLPRYRDVQTFALLYRASLMLLIPAVEELTGRFHKDDVPARVALAGIAEARRRLDEIEAVGLVGEVARAQRLARSVLALCDHYDNLSGLRMCAVCDKPILADQGSHPYDLFSDSGGARTSLVHADCMPSHTRD